MSFDALLRPRRTDWQGLVNNILRKGTTDRVYFIELFHDPEVSEALIQRFQLTKGLDPNSPDFARRRYIALQRFCGLDYVCCGLNHKEFIFNWSRVEDQAEMKREIGRNFMNENAGPITNWQQFEQYPWPDLDSATTTELEWYQKNLPEDMCIVAHTGHFMEFLSWLMGYETLCFALYEQLDLVEAIASRLQQWFTRQLGLLLQCDRIRIIWASDDMGYRSGTLMSPEHMRKYVLAGHKKLAEMTHAAGRPYILHSCGNLRAIMDDLVDDVKIDGKHSYEDTIEDVRQVKSDYGRKIALLGGIDLDFLARSDEAAIRSRVRETLDSCMPGGGFCLGSGNSVTNYVPLDNYLTMLEEGLRY